MRQETATISASLTTVAPPRVAGGSLSRVGAPGAPGPTPPPPPPEGQGDKGQKGDQRAQQDQQGGQQQQQAQRDNRDQGQDDGGDEEPGAEPAQAAGGGGGNPNVLIDTSRITSSQAQIDTPIMSGANTSLWQGADGLLDGDGTP